MFEVVKLNWIFFLKKNKDEPHAINLFSRIELMIKREKSCKSCVSLVKWFCSENQTQINCF